MLRSSMFLHLHTFCFSWQNAYDPTSGFRHLTTMSQLKMDWLNVTLSDISRTVCVFFERATIFLLQFLKMGFHMTYAECGIKTFWTLAKRRKNNVNMLTVAEFRFNSISIKPCILTSENTTFLCVWREHKHPKTI